MTYLRLRPWINEIAKDRAALSLYADNENWRRTDEGVWVFIGPGTGPTIAVNALEKCEVSKSLLPRSTRKIEKALISDVSPE